MIDDARTMSPGSTLETDVCIIGAGAAGIALAREFLGHPARVLLLESGGEEYEVETQNLARGESVGLHYWPLETARLRYLGGTTNHWSGWCRPLEPIDFEARDWIAHSGWPIDREMLDPYYERAAPVCQIGAYRNELDYWDTGDRLPLPLDAEGILTRAVMFSPPTRFGAIYRDELARAANVRTLLHANVTEITREAGAAAVSGVAVATLDGKRFAVRARVVVLAAGGLENPRVLLLSETAQPGGLGNQHDVVGRYFMNHLHLVSGIMLLSDPGQSMALYGSRLPTRPQSGEPTPIMGHLALSARLQREHRLLGFSANPRSLDITALADNLTSVEGWWRDFATLVRNTDEIARAGLQKIRDKLQPGTRPPMYELVNMTEQAPNPASRVMLGEERDALGQRVMRFDWQLSEIDLTSVHRAHELLGRALGATGSGRMLIMLDPQSTHLPPRLNGDYHHMGTTRMAADPRHGVVDADCRVHTVPNLYVAGSSVFPTSGFSNPTLTIVALALRLADHLKAELSGAR